MSPVERSLEAYECPSCGRLRLYEYTSCCGVPAEPFERTVVVEPPDIAQVAQNVFGIAPTGLAVCHALVAEGEATVDEIASQLDIHRSNVHRHVNQLVEVGLATKQSDGLPDGGQVKVYSASSPEEIRRALTLGLHVWLEEATELVDDLTAAKIEAMVEHAEEARADGTLAERAARDEAGEVDSRADGEGHSPVNDLLDRDRSS